MKSNIKDEAKQAPKPSYKLTEIGEIPRNEDETKYIGQSF